MKTEGFISHFSDTMAPKKKPGPRGARGAGPGQPPSRSLPTEQARQVDPGIDIVFDKPKPKSRGHRQRFVPSTSSIGQLHPRKEAGDG